MTIHLDLSGPSASPLITSVNRGSCPCATRYETIEDGLNYKIHANEVLVKSNYGVPTCPNETRAADFPRFFPSASDKFIDLAVKRHNLQTARQSGSVIQIC